MSDSFLHKPTASEMKCKEVSNHNCNSAEWRFDKKPLRPKSCGISPKSFHSNILQTNGNGTHYVNGISSSSFNPDKQGKAVIRRLRDDSEQRLLSEWNKEQECKRSVYRQLTSCSTFPLQQYSIDFWKKLQSEYMNDKSWTHSDSLDREKHVFKNGDEGNLTGNSSSSGNSAILDPEPKRQLRYARDSPRKSEMKIKFQERFLEEQKLLHNFVEEYQISAFTKLTLDKPETDNCKNVMNPNKEKEIVYEMKHLHQKPALWSMQPRLWSKESTTNGKRKYVTAHAGRFFDWYWRKCEIRDRHCYELILEQVPCRLYLDIEFSKKANPSIDAITAEQLLDDLYQELALEIQEQFGCALTRDEKDDRPNISNIICDKLERHHIVDLESSTESKFSRHWIVHIPLARPRVGSLETNSPTTKSLSDDSFQTFYSVSNEALFEDSSSAGRFMTNFVGRLAEQQATGALIGKRPFLSKYLFVSTGKKIAQKKNLNSLTSTLSVTLQDDDAEVILKEEAEIDEVTCFIDLGVYTRNRLFRLLGSSKFGKPPSAALRIASANRFPFPEGFDNACFYLPEIERLKTEQIGLKPFAVGNESGINLQSSQSDSPFQMSCIATDNFIVNEKEQKAINCTVEKSFEDMKNKADWTIHADALASTLVIPLNVYKLDFFILPSPKECQYLPSKPVCHSDHTRILKSSFTALTKGDSPFPMLDDFVTNHLALRKGLKGSIQSYSLKYVDTNDLMSKNRNTLETTKRPLQITYHMIRNRWCECVGRAHRSNNIMWNFDLIGPPFYCYQTCWDIECRRQNFRGSLIVLPETVSEALHAAMACFTTESQLPAIPNMQNYISNKENGNEAFDDSDHSFEQALAMLNLDDIV